MMIHMWMHWFWITTVYFRGFLLLCTISLTCSSHSTVTEAGLLENYSSTFPTPSVSNSSQIGYMSPFITLLPIVKLKTEDDLTETTPETSQLFTSSLPVPTGDRNTQSAEVTRIPQESTSDLEDIYNGGGLESLHYPSKKPNKYSRLKYGKVRTKGKAGEESVDPNRNLETLKLVEEKVKINLSIVGDGVGRSQEVDKSGDGLPEGSTSVITTTDAPYLMTMTLATDDGAGILNHTFEKVLNDEPFNGTSEGPKDADIMRNDTLIIENKVEESAVRTTVEPFFVKNRVAAATSAQNYEVDRSSLNAGSITGITLGILVVFSLFGAVSFVLYRRRYLNKPQVLHDKCSNLDSSGYIDETSLRENSEEMYSLDNDSFLNSLEAMTIQNYWTENVKHTKL